MSRATRSLMAGAIDVSPVAVGIVPFGLVAGAAVTSAGFGLREALGMSLLVNAGASQLAAIALFGQGAPLLVAILTALVVNARFFIYGASIAPVLAPKAGRLRPFLGHMLVDQSYAATMTIGHGRAGIDVVAYYAGTWLLLASVWQVTNVAGALAGTVVPASWSLDFAVPLVFLGMLVAAVRDRGDVEAAVVTGVAAAILAPALPLQTGLLASILLGIVWTVVRSRAEERSPRASTADGETAAAEAGGGAADR